MCEACNTSPEFLTREGESRRGFLTTAGAATVAAPLAATSFAGAARAQEARSPLAKSQVQSWAAFDTDGSFAPQTITRRAAGPKDVVVEIMYSSICHSDIHTYKGDWGPQVYKMQPFLNMLKLDKTLVNVGALFPVEGAQGMMMSFNRQSLAGSMTGCIAETQAVIDFAADHGVAATYEMITPDQIGEACEKVVNKEVRYRYVIDMTAV